MKMNVESQTIKFLKKKKEKENYVSLVYAFNGILKDSLHKIQILDLITIKLLLFKTHS